MNDRYSPYAGMNLSDIAAESDAADLEVLYEEHEILANDPTD